MFHQCTLYVGQNSAHTPKDTSLSCVVSNEGRECYINVQSKMSCYEITTNLWADESYIFGSLDPQMTMDCRYSSLNFGPCANASK